MSETTLDKLHEELAQAFINRIKDGECPAGVLKEAREFLKDNGIEQPKPQAKSPMGNLAAVLPFEEPTGSSHN